MKKKQTGIQSKEDLIRYVEGFEILAFKQFKNIEVENYEKVWDIFVERKLKLLAGETPKEVIQEWFDIGDDRKEAWIEKLKSHHQEIDIGNSGRIK